MKGMVDYVCEECRRKERAIKRDCRKKGAERELRKFIEQTRREITETEEWLRQEEEAEAALRCIEPSAMFYLLKRCGGIAALDRFDFRIELEDIAAVMGLTVPQAATWILVAGLQRRCPCGVGPAHLSRYTGEEHTSSAWKEHLSDLYRLGLLSIAKRTDSGVTYFNVNVQ